MHAPADAEPQRRRVGVFGGTFDPIHYGHLAAADEVANRYCLDEVMFVPAGDPWQKSGVTSSEHRYLMTVLATTSHPRFTVSRLDIDRGGRSYTVDTLTDLRTQHPDWELFFICGADAIAQMSSWKDAERLEDIAQLLAVSRPGHPLPLSGAADKRLHVLEVPAMAISSTDCRDRVANGRPIWYLVPDGVVQYIAKHRLYTNGSD